jgi:hypothetical protein
MLPIYDFADNLSGNGWRVAISVAILERQLGFGGSKARKQEIEAYNSADVSEAKEKSWEFGFMVKIRSMDLIK